MPRPTKISMSPPAAVEEALQRMGRNIRTARLRRNLPQDELAQRIGVSRFVVADIERGKPTTGTLTQTQEGAQAQGAERRLLSASVSSASCCPVL